MVLYAGDSVGIAASVRDPFSKKPILEGITVVAHFYGPGKDPANDPDVRDSPDHGPVSLAYDLDAETRRGVKGAWVGFTPTTDWEHGRWAYRITVTGAYENVEFGSFNLRE